MNRLLLGLLAFTALASFSSLYADEVIYGEPVTDHRQLGIGADGILYVFKSATDHSSYRPANAETVDYMVRTWMDHRARDQYPVIQRMLGHYQDRANELRQLVVKFPNGSTPLSASPSRSTDPKGLKITHAWKHPNGGTIFSLGWTDEAYAKFNLNLEFWQDPAGAFHALRASGAQVFPQDYGHSTPWLEQSFTDRKGGGSLAMDPKCVGKPSPERCALALTCSDQKVALPPVTGNALARLQQEFLRSFQALPGSSPLTTLPEAERTPVSLYEGADPAGGSFTVYEDKVRNYETAKRWSDNFHIYVRRGNGEVMTFQPHGVGASSSTFKDSAGNSWELGNSHRRQGDREVVVRTLYQTGPYGKRIQPGIALAPQNLLGPEYPADYNPKLSTEEWNATCREAMKKRGFSAEVFSGIRRDPPRVSPCAEPESSSVVQASVIEGTH